MDLHHARVNKYASIRCFLLYDLKNLGLTQLTITWSKSTSETLGNDKKYVQSEQ